VFRRRLAPIAKKIDELDCISTVECLLFALFLVQEMTREEKRILIVDDDAAIRTLVFTILRRQGLSVDTAKNGAEALEKLESCKYVLLILDLMMPLVSGWEVLQRLATLDGALRPMVIVLTAGSEPRDFNNDFVVGSVRKPFDVQLLDDIVVGCLSTTRPRPQDNGCPPSESDDKRPEKEN
jgi:CheY-like chemotaxis protein